MYSLFIDTHFKEVVIVLYKDGKLIGKKFSNNERHSVVTMPLIEEILKYANIKINDIQEIIVVNGPGSFTGVRIAVTISKMLAYALDLPIKVVDYLQIMAWFSDKRYVSIVDRNGAFVGEFNREREAIGDYKYYNKNDYGELLKNNDICDEIEIDYDRLYQLVKNIKPTLVHAVNPLYVKNLEV